jgi:hypothetical protein
MFMKLQVILLFLSISMSGYGQIPTEVMNDWNQLTEQGGTWISEDNTGTYDAWGMKYTWGLGKKSVDGILYAIRDGEDIGTLWQYKIFYHPVEGKIVLEQWGSDGSYGEGTIVIRSASTSENVSTFYNPDGSIFRLKHVQELQSGVKTSQTFVSGENDDWVTDRLYTWRRVPGD